MTRRWLEPPTGVCVSCGDPTWSKLAAPLHRRCRPRAAPRPPTSYAERQRRAEFVEAWIAQVGGPWCLGWGREGHWATGRNMLTADHIAAVAQGGTEDGPLQALCRSCNSSKRGKSGRVGTSRPPQASEPVYPGASGTC